MQINRQSILESFRRCLALKCPVCGQSRIIQRPFKIAERCNACGVDFNREQGFFVGAILINVVTTEAFILAAYLISIVLLNLDSEYALVPLFLIAVLFPVAFYHHSWSLWLMLDHFIETLPSGATSKSKTRH